MTEYQNTPETEEENDIVVEETQEAETAENQEEVSLDIPEETVEPENTEVPVETELPEETEEPVVQDENLETSIGEEVESTAMPETTDVPAESEEPLPDEEIEMTEILEILETAPIEFKEIQSEFVVETEDGFVFEEAIDEYTSVYASTEEEGLKQLVIGESPINVQVDQSFEPISLALNENTASTYSLRNNTGWSNLNNTIQSTYPVDPEDGITFTVKGKSLTLKSMMNSAGDPVQQDNQIIYPMEGNVNLRYIIQPGVISEDIMIYSPEASSTYSYEVFFEYGRLASAENVIAVIDENEELLMYITAPVAYDASGAETEVTLTYEDGIMSVSIDEQWMRSEERVYPIVIDPEYHQVSYNSSMGIDISVGSNHAAYTWGNLNMEDYGYVLPNNLSYHAYIFLGDTPLLKDAYSFYRLKMEHPVLYETLRGTNIISAYLRLSTGEDGKVSKDNVIITEQIPSSYNISNAKYTNRPSGTEISRTDITSGNWKEVDIDITDYVEGYYESDSYTDGMATDSLKLYLADQRGYAQFHAFEYVCWDQKGWYTPYVIVNYVDFTSIDITELQDSELFMRPFVNSDYDTGIIDLEAVGFDGRAPLGSEVSVTVRNNDTIVYTETCSVTKNKALYPDYEGQGDEELTSNWQMSGLFETFAADQVYDVTMTITKDGQTCTKTASFKVLESSTFDTAAGIADHHGISQTQLMDDNNMQDDLILPGNILFVRGEKNRLETVYNPEDLSEDEEKRVIAALRGRDLVCEYGIIPVNLNTGSYLLESRDFSYNLFNQDYSFMRTYNSTAAENAGIFGYGWSYTGQYAAAGSAGGATVLLEDGTKYYFERKADGSYWSEHTRKYHLSYEVDHFVLESKEKTVVFNVRGKPVEIIDRTGLKTLYSYEGGQLSVMTLPDGKTVSFDYTDGKVTKLTMSDGSYVSYTYDQNNDLISFTDQSGAVTSYSYDADHNMTSWTDPNEELVIRNEYDNEHRIVKQFDNEDVLMTQINYTEDETIIKDKDGIVIKTIEKDGNSYTSKIIHPDGNTELKVYVNGELIEQTLENGVSYDYTYDDRGNLIKSVRNDGFTIDYEYDEGTYNLKKQTNSFGQEKSYTYDEHNNLLTFTDERGKTTSYTYNELNQKTSETDPNGHTTSYQYNPQGKVIKKINPDLSTVSYQYNASGYLIQSTDEAGNVTRHELNERNQIIKIIQADAGVIQYEHDDAGNVIKTIMPNGGIITSTYDEHGNVLSTTDAYEHLMEDPRSTVYVYDQMQNLISKTLPNGHVTSYEYDKRNRVTKEIVDGVQTRYEYNRYGLEKIINAKGQIKRNEYDALGRLVKITDFDGKTISYTYDVLSRVTSETDKKGNVTSYEYDLAGNIIKKSTSREVIDYVYDDAGNLIQEKSTVRRENETEDTIKITQMSYDAMDRLISITDPEGNITVNVYENGRLKSKSDGLGRTVTYTYDSMNRIIKETYSDGTVLTKSYDKEGNVVSEIDGRGNTTSYEYNKRSDLIKKTDPYNKCTLYAVDTMKNVVSITSPAGVITSYEYDLSGNVTKEKLSGRVIKAMTYDAYHRLETETVLGVTKTYVYDSYDNIIKTTEPSFDENEELVTDYVYDEYHRLTEKKLNSSVVESYVYDVYDQVTLFTDKYGMETAYIYNDDQTVYQKSRDGIIETYQYDLNDQLIKMTDNIILETETSGNEILYAYDAAGNMITETENGQIRSYEYDCFDREIKKTDALGRVTLTSYDKSGNITQIINGAGNITLYAYTKNNQLESESVKLNASGAAKLIKRYEYDADGRLVKETSGDSSNIQYQYDLYDQVIKKIDERGYSTEYSYDTRGNVIKITDAKQNETEMFYNQLNQLIRTVDPENNQTVYEYDIYGNVSKITDGEGKAESYEYLANGNISEKTDKAGITSLWFYQDGKPWVYSLGGHMMEYHAYDDYGRPANVQNEDRVVEVYKYDKRGNLIILKDGNLNTTSYEYDAEDQLIKMTDPNGTNTLYEYDGAGRLIKETVNSERVTSYEYDVYGNVSKIIDGEGISTSYEYDVKGHLIKDTDGLSKSRIYEYDACGNLIKETDRLGNSVNYVYDELGNLIQIKDKNGNATTYSYDDASRLIRVQDARGYSVSYTLDAVGNIVKQTSGDAEITYTYDGNGNVLTIKDPDNKTESFIYNYLQKIAKHTKKDGSILNMTYDASGNKLTENDVTYSYDNAGRLIQMVDEHGTTSYSYDAAGNLISTTQRGETVSYQYNAYHEKTKVVYPNGTEQTYSYDDSGKMTGTSYLGVTVTYAYDNAGRVVKEYHSNNIIVDIGYDAEGNITVYKNRLNNVLVNQSIYAYDKNGSVTRETRMVEGSSKMIDHVYNENDELIKTTETVNGTATVTQYTYSLTGNKATVVNGSTTQSFTYNDMNQLTEYSDGQHTYTYTYDDNGNRIQERRNDGQIKTYSYDIHDNLTEVTDPNGISAEYRYDGTGNRIYEKQTYGAVSVEFEHINDYTSENVEVLSKKNGTAYQNSFYGTERLSNRGRYYLYDGSGNVVFLVADGSIIGRYGYSDHGVTTVQLNDIENDVTSLVDEWTKLLNNEYGYNGEAQTVDGLQYLRSRYYDAETGVFISRDSYRGEVQDLLSQNRYTYARNNPIKYDDPTGHLPLNGVNKYASNASMDVGDSLKRLEPLKGSFSSTGTKNTSYNKGPLLTGTSKTPSVKTEAVMFDEGDVTTDKQTQTTGALENDDPGTVSSIVTEPHDNTQPYGVETYDTPESGADNRGFYKWAATTVIGAAAFLMVMGIGAIAGLTWTIGAGIVSAGVSGYAEAYINDGIDMIFDSMNVEAYAKSRGYKDVDTYKRDLKNEASAVAYISIVLAIAGAMKTTSPRIGAEHSDDAAKAVENAVSTGQKGMTAGESGTPSGYYQDATGKWHRPNGQFASNTEVGLPSSSDHYLNRPYIRQETIDAVNAKTKVNYKTGQIYDSITKKWVDPSDVELGHTKGNEFAYYRDWAESQGWTQSQFNDFMNNPDFYAWQDVYSNRSHKFEAKH